MKKILTLAIVLAASIFFACSEDPSGTQTDLTGTVTILAQDAVTGGLLSTAKVTFTGIDKEAKPVNDKGAVQYTNIPMGADYKIKVEAEGYAPIVCEIDVSGVGQSNVIVMDNEVYTFTMFKNSVELEGFLYYEDEDGNRFPAKDAKLVAELTSGYYGCEFAEPFLNITVGADGKYTFKVPEYSIYYLVAPEQEYDGILREAFFIDNNGVSNNPKGNIISSKTVNSNIVNQGFFVKSKTKGVNEDTKTPIEVVFSKEVAMIGTRKVSDIDFAAITNLGTVTVTVTFDGKKLTITPEDDWVAGTSSVNFVTLFGSNSLTSVDSEEITFGAFTVSRVAADN